MNLIWYSTCANGEYFINSIALAHHIVRNKQTTLES